MNFVHRSCTISYTVLASFSATGAITGEVLSTLDGELPYRAWVPYDYTSTFLFWLTSLHEMLALIFGTIVNIATETLLLVTLLLCICAQFEILTHRLRRETESDDRKEGCKNLFNDAPNRSRLSEHVHYHLCIIRFVKQLKQ